MKDVVAEYIKGRYLWFVFDVVDLKEELKTKDAVQFRFRTPAATIRCGSPGPEPATPWCNS